MNLLVTWFDFVWFEFATILLFYLFAVGWNVLFMLFVLCLFAVVCLICFVMVVSVCLFGWLIGIWVDDVVAGVY